MTIEFVVTSIVVILLPGTGVVYTLSIGIGRGFRASIAAAFGCTLGILPAAIASIVGLAAVLHTSAMAFQGLKYLGAAYLLYMAWSVLRDGGTLDVAEQRSQTTAWRIIINGMVINILNPKLSLFFLAFLPQFVPAGSGTSPALVFLAVVFMVLTFVIFVGYGAGAALTRDYVISRPAVMKWMKRSFAGAFGFLALKLALSDR